MKQSTVQTIIFLLLLVGCNESNVQQKNNVNNLKFDKIPVDYPIVKKDNVVENYHGTKISDPYRWLEDDHSEETGDWVKAQNQVTFSYLDQIPYRDAIKTRLEELWNYERFSTPFKEGDKFYFFKNDGLQNQSVMYTQETLDSEATLILDPNKFSDDGTTSLGGLAFNKKGNLLAYQVSEGGSDWRKVYVKDLENNKMLTDELDWLKFSGISWFGDGFYYSRYPEPKEDDKLSGANQFHQVYFHKLGTPQSEDQLIYADRTNPKRNMYVNTTDDERFLVMSVVESTSGNALYFKDLSKSDDEFTPLWESYENDFRVIDNDGSKLLVLTNYQAPNNKLIAIDTENPGEKNWEEIIQ